MFSVYEYETLVLQLSWAEIKFRSTWDFNCDQGDTCVSILTGVKGMQRLLSL